MPMSASDVAASRGRAIMTVRASFGLSIVISAVWASSRWPASSVESEPAESYVLSAESPDMIASRPSSPTTRLSLPFAAARPVGV